MSSQKKVVLAFALASTMITSTAFAVAVRPATSTPKADAMREQAAEKRDAAKMQMEERRAGIIRKHTERVVRRFNEAIDRLENVADRISARLEKLAGQQTYVATAQAKLITARQKIAEARMAVEAITAVANTSPAATASSTPKMMMDNIRTAMMTAEVKIKAAHAALVDVINSIKPGLFRATSTPSATP